MTVCDTIYDIIAAIISLTDLVTDLMVIYGYYISDRMVFFTIAMIIVILAQITYAFWFAARYGEHWPVGGRVLLFFIILPVAPFISFVFMMTVEDDTLCAKCLKSIGLSVAEWGFDENDTALKVWMKRKMAKHFIFVQEAIIEAFPQSILQLIALVYYQETSFNINNPFAIINIISILISITSIASKALIASANAINIKFVLYNWILFCTDFFGIFFIVSWIFYKPITESNVGEFFIYKSLICNSPLILFVGLACCIKLWWVIVEDYVIGDGYIACCCSFCLITLFSITIWFGGTFIAYMLSEILLFSFLPIATMTGLNFKIADMKGEWYLLLRFISNSKSRDDTKLRICCANQVVLRRYYKGHGKWIAYFDEVESTLYENFQLSHVRTHFKRTFIGVFKRLVYETVSMMISNARDANYLEDKLREYGLLFTLFVLMPLYVISRIINFIYPVVIFVHVYSQNMWSEISLLQYVFSVVYLVLLLLVFIACYSSFQQQYYIWHLLPGIEQMRKIESSDVDIMRDYYNELVVIPGRTKVLNDVFGSDIAAIVAAYLPHSFKDMLAVQP